MNSHPLRGIQCHIKQEGHRSRPQRNELVPIFLDTWAPWVCFPPLFTKKKKKRERKDPLTFLFILETNSVMQ